MSAYRCSSSRFALFLVPTLLSACGDGSTTTASWSDAAKQREAALANILNGVREKPAELSTLLTAMPKGADLHSHLSGAISTENLIFWGAKDGTCVDKTTLVTSAPPCAGNTAPLSTATAGSDLYNQILAAWSMQGFTGEVASRHQHFFDAFSKFGVVTGNRGTDGTDDVVRRAAAQGEVHLELLVGLSGSTIGKLADTMIKSTDPWTDDFLKSARDKLMKDPQFQAALQSSVDGLNQTWNDLRARWRCDTTIPEPACDVTVRYLIQGTRTQSREYVFGQWLFGFELAQIEPRVVGINLVAPEEDANSLQNYDDEMKAVRFLRASNAVAAGRTPVHVSLHAGELIPQVLPMTPSGQQNLLFHIRDAVEVAGAERIGHSADILGENQGPGMDPMMLLNDMATKGVAVEACLTSNQQLLGLEAGTHPLSAYMAAGVPIALSTDDEGILRTNLTAEYLRGASVQGMSYQELKTSARIAVEKSFLQGQSLWADYRSFAPVAACSDREPGGVPSETCLGYLGANQRATQQWKLEAKLIAFEQAQLAAMPQH